ncbi:MAG: DUF6624 domain-containing protein [Pseudomonadota bacterium]
MLAVLSAIALTAGSLAPQSVDELIAQTEPYPLTAPSGPREVRRVSDDLMQRTARARELRGQIKLLSESAGAEAKADSLAKLQRELDAVSRENRVAVQGYIDAFGWFPQNLWNWAASWHAAIIVRHADDDPNLQRRVLATMQPLVDQDRVSLKTYALLFDKVAASASLPQRYGNEGRCVRPGVWEPLPLEDPANIDTLRNEAGLEPLAPYADFESQSCR